MLPSRSLLTVLALLGTSTACVNESERSWVDDDPTPEDPPVVKPATPDSGTRVPDAGRDASLFPLPSDAGRFPTRLPDARVLPPPERLELIQAEEPPPAISGGSLTLTADGNLAVAADPDRDVVYVIDVASSKVASATLPKGSEPGRVVLDGTGHAHVILRNSEKVARIALATATVDLETRVCEHPRGLAHDPTADALLVACGNGELVSLAARTHAELSRAFVALDLRDVVITKTGQRYVSRYRSAELVAIDRDGKATFTSHPDTVSTFGNTGPVTMSPTLAWRTTAAADGTVVMLHQAAQNEPVVASAGGYGGGCQTIARPSVTRYDEQGKVTVTAGIVSASLAVDVAIAADGDTVAIANPGGYLRGGGTIGVVKLSFLSSGGMFTKLDAGVASGVHDAGPARDAGVAVDGGLAGAFAPLLPAPVDGGSGALPFPSDAGRPGLPCSGFMAGSGADSQTTAVAFDRAGKIYAFSREPAELHVYELFDFELREERVIKLHTRSVRDTGHELFHADVGSGLSCASCHGEARDDGHVWTFQGFGPRRTQNMRGGILSTEPLHWEGDMPTFKHLVDEVMTGRMGGFKVEEQYARALAQWIDTQPELLLTGRDASAIARGKALFEAAETKCATCHNGPQFTNNTSVDVGTGRPFQVPTLIGLALRGPYMHDGCAKSLRERFDPGCGGGDKHGKTSHLTAAQIGDLVTYLESL